MNVHIPPLLAYRDDMPLAQLNTAELLLTATVRLYARSRRGETDGLDWHEGLLTAGVRPCGIVAFGILLDAILSASQAALDIRCPCCSALGKDEGKLLQAIALLQQRRFGEAHAILGRWLAPLEQGAMLSPAAHVAFACAAAGLRVPWRHCDTTMLAYCDVSGIDAGLHFVH